MGCPLADKGRGFVLGSGDPGKAKFAIILEAPGSDEIGFDLSPMEGRRFLTSKEDVDREIAARQRDYPDIPLSLLRKGAPVVGKSGSLLNQWVFPQVGLKRDDLYIDNVLRCLPPKNKQGRAYPTGDERKLAEKCCRVYDRFEKLRPEVAVISLHPAGILREVTPLPLLIKDFEKARDFVAAGYRTMILLGGMSAKAFMRWGENVTKWRGDYRVLPGNWAETYRAFFDNVRVKVERARKTAVVVDGPEDLFETIHKRVQKRRVKKT